MCWQCADNVAERAWLPPTRYVEEERAQLCLCLKSVLFDIALGNQKVMSGQMYPSSSYLFVFGRSLAILKTLLCQWDWEDQNQWKHVCDRVHRAACRKILEVVHTTDALCQALYRDDFNIYLTAFQWPKILPVFTSWLFSVWTCWSVNANTISRDPVFRQVQKLLVNISSSRSCN